MSSTCILARVASHGHAGGEQNVLRITGRRSRGRNTSVSSHNAEHKRLPVYSLADQVHAADKICTCCSYKYTFFLTRTLRRIYVEVRESSRLHTNRNWLVPTVAVCEKSPCPGLFFKSQACFDVPRSTKTGSKCVGWSSELEETAETVVATFEAPAVVDLRSTSHHTACCCLQCLRTAIL